MTDLSTKIVTGVGSVLERRFSRRSLLGRTAVVGAAVAVGGVDFVLRPTPAYASVCGPGATCSEGWTVMCCTINNGVNQCPPGSFAGGWWKADSAGLCGGTARYYIDCQGECTHCGCGGGNFCAEGCWNCTKRCNTGTCDERRVCWNVFRYGQCNQQVGCSGPVLCRMISCVPPWQFLACTTDAATDDNTTDHSAPCLPAWSAIQAKYAALGGAGSGLGPEVDAEFAVTGGTAQRTVSGQLYDSSSAGAHYLRVPRLTAYDAGGGPAAFGLPTTDEVRTSDGLGIYNELANNASVYSSPAGTAVVSGAVRTRWVALGREKSALGYPAGPLSVLAGGGSQQIFQHGAMATSASGTFPILAPAYSTYEATGSGVLGVPTADATASGRNHGTVQQFTKGLVAWLPGGAGYAVTGTTYTVWQAAGGTTSPLGLPTAAQTTAGGVTEQVFQDGAVVGSSATGTHAIWGGVYQQWAASGGATGHYGLPTSDMTVGTTASSCTFQHGQIVSYDPRRKPGPSPF